MGNSSAATNTNTEVSMLEEQQVARPSYIELTNRHNLMLQIKNNCVTLSPIVKPHPCSRMRKNRWRRRNKKKRKDKV